MQNSLWHKDAVFYEIYVRAFADGNGDGHGDFIGLTQKLDYLCDLGVDCLWLMPVYPSPLKDAGYDVADYYNIHPDYGTLADFKSFLAQAHRRGLRVIVDLVLNHTSDQHTWFQAARTDRNSPYRDYYVWSDTDQKYTGARSIALDADKSDWTWDEAAGQYFWHRFCASQPDLNFDNPAVRGEMFNVFKFWLDLGLDGFRVDAVPYLFERDGTNCENLPETHAYLEQLRRFLDEHYPDCILLADANQWLHDLRSTFSEGDECHMVFHVPVRPRIIMALANADSTPIVEILSGTPPGPESCQWCTFLRNHDELMSEIVASGAHQWMWQNYKPQPRLGPNLGIRRMAPLLEGDRRKIELAHSILLSLPGPPILYCGDEIGIGDKLRQMIAVRKQYLAFSRGGCEFVPLNTQAALGVCRTDGRDMILALHNLSPTLKIIQLDLLALLARMQVKWKPTFMRDLLSNRIFSSPLAANHALALQPYEILWLRLDSTRFQTEGRI